MSHSQILSDLVERLRAADFQIAPDDYLRAVRIVDGAENLPRNRLGSLLCPLFADRREQQERFAAIFKEVVEPKTPPPPPPAASLSARRSPFIAAFFATLTVFALAFAAWRVRQSIGAADTPPIDPSLDTSGLIPRPVITTIPVDELSPALLSLTTAAALLAGTAALVLLAAWRRRHPASRAPEAGPPYRWKVQSGGSPAVFTAETLGRLSRALRGKTESDTQRLDIERTVAEAARSPEEPRLVYAADLATPEYVVLIEKRSEHDHQAAYFDRLVSLLSADGVDLRRYYFDYDPRVCWTSRRSRTRLADVYHRSPNARLIVFGSPRALFDAVTGNVDHRVLREFRWSIQAVVTIDDAPSDVPGLRAFGGAGALTSLADSFSGGYRERKPRVARRSSLAEARGWREIKGRISPAAWRWLLACAVYPRLQWELTIALGAAVSASAMSALRELVALPWFRDGAIPDGERTALVDELRKDADLERVVRNVIIDLLGRTPLPAGSFALREKELQLLTQELWLHREDRPALRTRFRRLREFRIAEIGRDSSLLRLLLTAPGTLIASRVPQPVRRLWFRSGVPAMGRRPLHGLPVALCIAALAFAMVPPDKMMRPSATKTIESVTTTYEPTVTDTGSTVTLSSFLSLDPQRRLDPPSSSTGAPTKTDTTATRHALTGRVVNALNQTPIESAVIMVAVDRYRVLGRTLTGSQGSFRLTWSGAYTRGVTIQIAKPGFETLQMPASPLEADRFQVYRLFPLTDTRSSSSATSPDVTSAAPAGNNESIRTEVHFEPRSASLTDIGKAVIEEIVVMRMKPNPNERLVITGYTDDRETTGPDQDLDFRRATAARDHILTLGIDGSRVSVQRGGTNNPVGDNSTPEGRLRNRRIVMQPIVSAAPP